MAHQWPYAKTQNTKIKTALAVFIFCALLLPTYILQATSYKLTLVSARDQIPGSFTTAQSLYADKGRIYLASAQGKLFVLERNRQKDFPVLETINFNTRLTAVAGNENKLYLAAASGAVYVYDIPRNINQNLRKIETKLLNDYGISSLAVNENGIVVAGLGQARVAVNKDYIFLSGLNPGDDAYILASGKQLSFQENYKATDVYGLDGSYTGTISNFGQSSVSFYAGTKDIYMTYPGCCGRGVGVYDGYTFAQKSFIASLYANTVVNHGNNLIVAGEDGQVHLMQAGAAVDTIDLRTHTGHTGIEDIEIRALWADNYDNFIFAASSWGNDFSRSNNLPSFFVVELANSEERMVNSQDSSLSALGEGGGEAGYIASGIISVSTAQALEIDQSQIETTTNTDSTSSPSEIYENDESVDDYITKFFLTISKAFKFLFGLIV